MAIKDLTGFCAAWSTLLKGSSYLPITEIFDAVRTERNLRGHTARYEDLLNAKQVVCICMLVGCVTSYDLDVGQTTRKVHGVKVVLDSEYHMLPLLKSFFGEILNLVGHFYAVITCKKRMSGG